jgi:hypothetical protein
MAQKIGDPAGKKASLILDHDHLIAGGGGLNGALQNFLTKVRELDRSLLLSNANF